MERFWQLLVLILALTFLAACRPHQVTPTLAAPGATPAVVSVPAEFRALFAELDAALTAFDQALDAPDESYPVIFAAELLPANGNRGTELLKPTSLQNTRLWLDRLQQIGVQGVTVAIKYPLLTPDFPNSARYLEYFKTVANEIRQRGMKMDVKVGVVFPPPFSALDVNYRAITFEQFKAANKQMVTTIVTEIKPDYLNLAPEPDTIARIAGWREFTSPQACDDWVSYTLKDLNRGNTKIGAGIGTWGNLDFIKRYAANTSLDFIALHIYPVTGNALPTAIAAADLAHQHNKRVILDEVWLYKMSAREPPVSIAGNAEVFRRDAYSFWAPLDQKFLALVAKLARAKKIEYVSVFWAQYLYAYLDYNPKYQTMPYNDVMAHLNTIATPNVLAGKLSSTGEFYKRLSQGAR